MGPMPRKLSGIPIAKNTSVPDRQEHLGIAKNTCVPDQRYNTHGIHSFISSRSRPDPIAGPGRRVCGQPDLPSLRQQPQCYSSGANIMNVEPTDLFRVRSRPRQRREDTKQYPYWPLWYNHTGVAPVMVPERPVTQQPVQVGMEEGGGQNNHDNRLVGHTPRYDHCSTLRRITIANTASRASPTVDRKQIVALQECLKVLQKEKANLELANSLLLIENQQVKQECQELRKAVELQEKDSSGASIMEGGNSNLEKKVSSDGYATQESPYKSKKKSNKQKEKGFKGEQDGDWYCPRNCLGSDTLVFAWRTECFKCQTPRPDGFDAPARLPSKDTDVLEIGQRTMSKSKSAMLSDDDDLNKRIHGRLSLSDLAVEVLSILQVGDYSIVHVTYTILKFFSIL